MSKNRTFILALAMAACCGLTFGCTPDVNEPEQPGPSTEDPGKEDPGKEDPGKEDPGKEDPGKEDPGKEDPGTEIIPEEPIVVELNDVILKLSATDNLITTEDGGTAGFEATLELDPGREVVLNVMSSNTAEGVVSTDNLVFNSDNWSQPQKITVTGVDDDVLDGDTEYSVVISYYLTDDSGEHSEETNLLAFEQKVKIVNKDNDKAELVISPSAKLDVSENMTQAAFSVALSVKPSSDVKIALASSDEVEAKIDLAELVFTPENWQTPQTVTVTGVDDTAIDGDKDVEIQLTVVDGDEVFKALGKVVVPVVNRDNDIAGVAVTLLNGQTTDEDGGSVPITVTLNTEPTADVTITVRSNDTTEGVVNISELVFTPEDWDIAQTVMLTGVQDGIYDGDQEYQVFFGNYVSDDAAYAAASPVLIPFTNVDTTAPGITVDPTELLTNESGSTAEFSVVLNAIPEANVSFTLTNKDTSEGAIDKTSLVFTPENWNVPQVVTVTGVDDSIVDKNDENIYDIEISNAVSDDQLYNGQFGTKVTVTNVDNDTPGLAVSAAELIEVGEDGTVGTFSIMLSTKPKGDVKVTFEPSVEDLVTVDVTELVFTPENWNVPQTVTITGTDDLFADGDHEFEIAFNKLSSKADSDYHGLKVDPLPCVLRDNDVANLQIKKPDGELKTSENGDKLIFSAALTSQPRSYVSVDLVISHPREAKFFISSMDFTPENWNVPRELVLEGLDDDYADGDITYTVTAKLTSKDPAYNGLEVEPVEIVNLDNDVATITVEPQFLGITKMAPEGKFTVSLSARPTSDVRIELTSTDNEGLSIMSADAVIFTEEKWEPKVVTIKGLNFPNELKQFKVELAKTETDCEAYKDMDPADVQVSLVNFSQIDFEYTGAVQSTKLYPGRYKLEVWGAQGGKGKKATTEVFGGPGGYSAGILTLTQESELFVYVGGAGSTSQGNASAPGGFNGGGEGQAHSVNGSSSMVTRGTGGGATDIRIGQDSLYARVIVAGGGGGAGGYDSTSCLVETGGEGGGESGIKGGALPCSPVRQGGGGGTISGGGAAGLYGSQVCTGTAGTFGMGGKSGNITENYYCGGGGGGGWYGGGGGAGGGGNGGGGSGWVFTQANDKAGYTDSSKTGGKWLLNASHYLTKATTVDGSGEFSSPDGSKEKGHAGNGYARISIATE